MSEILLLVFFLVFFLGGLAGIWIFPRTGHLLLVREAGGVKGQLSTRLLGVAAIRTTTLTKVDRAEVQHAHRASRRSSRVVLWAGEEMIPFQEVYTNDTSWKEITAARINRFIQVGGPERTMAISANVVGAWFFFLVLLLPITAVGGAGLYAFAATEALHRYSLPSLRRPQEDIIYKEGHWVSVPRSTAVPAEFPEGAYYPEFCSFPPVASNGKRLEVYGNTTMEVTPARKYVVGRMRSSGWEPYDGNMKPGAETFTYRKEGVYLTYTFVNSTVPKHEGVICWVTWGPL